MRQILHTLEQLLLHLLQVRRILQPYQFPSPWRGVGVVDGVTARESVQLSTVWLEGSR